MAENVAPGVIADETEAGKWLRRIQASRREMKKVLDERKKFAEVLSLSYMGQGDISMEARSFSQHAENYSYRFMRHVMSRATGKPLHIKMDRNAGEGQITPGDPGDHVTAPAAEEALRRGCREANLLEEINALVASICAYGVGCLVTGYHADVVTREIVEEAGQDSSQIQRDAQLGTGSASEEHDAVAEASRLRALVQDDPTLPPEQRESLLKRAREYDALADKQARTVTEKRIIAQNVWARFAQPGEEVVWDWTVSDVRDASWFAVRKYVTLDEFKSAKRVYKQSARTAVEGKGHRLYSTLDPDVQQTADKIDKDLRDPYVETWEIWIIKPRLRERCERRIVTPELPGKFIEKDRRNPYVVDGVMDDGTVHPDHGKSALYRGCPVHVCAPLKPMIWRPERMLGVPLIAPGWAQQCELNQFAAMRIASARRAKRLYGTMLGRESDEFKMLETFMRSDGDMFMFELPADAKTDAQKAKAAIVPYDLGNIRGELENAYQNTKNTWRELQGMPMAIMAVAGTDKTATQDQQSIQTGENELDSILESIEITVSDVVKDFRGLMREFYGPEKVAAMLGSRAATEFFAWAKTSLDGDGLEILLGSRAVVQERVDVKQQMEGFQLGQAVIDPVLGTPRIDPMPQLEAIFKSLKLGKPQELSPREKQLEQAAMQASAAARQMQEENDLLRNRLEGSEFSSKGGGSGKPGPDAQVQLDQPAPQNGAMEAGVRRETVTTGGRSAGG